MGKTRRELERDAHIRSRSNKSLLISHLFRETLQMRAHQTHIRYQDTRVFWFIVDCFAAVVDRAFAEGEGVADS
jgi:hypothetical protein